MILAEDIDQDIRYVETPRYFMPLAQELVKIDYSWSIKALYNSLIDLFRYLIEYYRAEEANDFYDGLRRSTAENHLLGNYFKIFKRIIWERMFRKMKKNRYFADYKLRVQMPGIMLRYFCENKISDRLIEENIRRG
jgi:hypothetical protein